MILKSKAAPQTRNQTFCSNKRCNVQRGPFVPEVLTSYTQDGSFFKCCFQLIKETTTFPTSLSRRVYIFGEDVYNQQLMNKLIMNDLMHTRNTKTKWKQRLKPPIKYFELISAFLRMKSGWWWWWWWRFLLEHLVLHKWWGCKNEKGCLWGVR